MSGVTMSIPFADIVAASKAQHEKSVTMLSNLIAAGSPEGGTSGLESTRAALLKKELEAITPAVYVDAFGNVCGAVGELENPKQTIWFIGHIDTVGTGEWAEAHTPKLVGNKLYGRGSSDQLAGVVSSVIALEELKKQEAYLKEQGIRVIAMGNPHEEDCEGESIKFLLAKAEDPNSEFPTWLKGLPDVMLTDEPTSDEDGMPRPYFGHRGRYLYELKVEGETGHGSIPVKYPAAEVFSRTIAAIFERVQGPISKKFGKDTYAFSTGKITSPSFNAHTEVAIWHIDLRIAPTSDPEILVDMMREVALDIRTKIAGEKGVSVDEIPAVTFSIYGPDYTTYTGHKFVGLQDLPGPWLSMEHPLRKLVLDVYQGLFGCQPPYDRKSVPEGIPQIDAEEGDLSVRDYFNFSTDLTGLAQLIRKAQKEGREVPKIAYLGLGSGIEEQAHRKDEYCPVNSLDNAAAFYIGLVLGLAEV